MGDLNCPVIPGQGKTTLIPPKAAVSQLFIVFPTLCSLIGRHKCCKGLLRNQDTWIQILSFFSKLFSSVQLLSRVRLFATP